MARNLFADSTEQSTAPSPEATTASSGGRNLFADTNAPTNEQAQANARKQLVDTGLQMREQEVRANRQNQVNQRAMEKQVNGAINPESGIRDKSTKNQDLVNTYNAITQAGKPKAELSLLERINAPEFTAPIEAGNIPGSDAFERGVASGGTLGFGDEASAAIRSALSPETTYDQAVNESRQLSKDYQEESPVAYTAGEITGTLPIGAGVASAATKGAQALNLGSKGAAATQIGAATAEGALAATGASEAELGSSEQLRDTATGAALGATFGTLGEAVGAGAKVASDFVSGNRGKKLIQEELLSIKPDDVSVDAYSKQLSDQLVRTDDAALADIDELQPLSQQLGKLSKADAQDAEALVARSALLETNIKEILDPTQIAGVSTVKGANIDGSEVVLESDLVSGTGGLGTEDVSGYGSLDLNQFTTRIRQKSNVLTENLYEAAYRTKPTSDQQDAVNFYRSEFPDFKKYWDQGKKNALNGDSNRKSLVKATDEAIKAINDDITVARDAGRNSEVFRLNTTKGRLTELLNDITPNITNADVDIDTGLPDGYAFNPVRLAKDIGAPPRQTASNIDAGFKSVTERDVRELDTLQRQTLAGIERGDFTGEQVGIGAGKALSEVIARTGRDSKTGKLLKDTQVANYNRVVTGDPKGFLDNFIGDDARAARAANLANKTPQTISEELRSAIPALAKDFGAVSALGAFIFQPNVITAGLVATRIGQAAVSRQNKKSLAKAGQKELFRLGATKADIDNILNGDFNAVPPERITNIAQGIAGTLGITAADGVVDSQQQTVELQ